MPNACMRVLLFCPEITLVVPWAWLGVFSALITGVDATLLTFGACGTVAMASNCCVASFAHSGTASSSSAARSAIAAASSRNNLSKGSSSCCKRVDVVKSEEEKCDISAWNFSVAAANTDSSKSEPLAPNFS